ncbi:MAG: hypothetical protein JW829_17185 [Pirellulales bacterium]|nr:hypothetical protein [Pirellulales bacterium]
MPGIFGIVSESPDHEGQRTLALRAMAMRMRHRVKYQEHTFSEGNISIGRCGLSFLNPEQQPVFTSDRACCLVFEGELYEPQKINQKLARNNATSSSADATLVLEAVARYGPEIIEELPGAYVGFFYDLREFVGYLFTDRLGLRGCYWTLMSNGTFCFASELKAIIAVPGFHSKLDTQGVAEFLSSGYPFFDRTFFTNVKFLPYASVLTVRGAHISIHRYWDVDWQVQWRNGQFEDAVHEGADLLIQAIGRQFRQRGTIGVMLSGGLDSRAIAAGAVVSGHDVPTFTLGGKKDTERELACRVAERLRVPNHCLAVPPDYLADYATEGIWYTDAMLSSRELYWTPYLDFLGAHADALISGHTAGLFLGGLFLEEEHLQNPSLHNQRQCIVRQIAGDFSTFLDLGLAPAFLGRAHDAFDASRQAIASSVGDGGFATELARAKLGTLERRLDSICYGYLWNVVADVKYPLGDHDLLDFCARVPLEWRFRSRLYKAILCKAFPQLVDIPCVSAKTNWLPMRIDARIHPMSTLARHLVGRARFLVSRLTRGRINLPPDRSKFTHDSHWYRTVPRLRMWLKSVLLDERTLQRGYFDREGISQLLNLQMRRGYLFNVLSRLISFEFWNRYFVDGDRYEQTVDTPLRTNSQTPSGKS